MAGANKSRLIVLGMRSGTSVDRGRNDNHETSSEDKQINLRDYHRVNARGVRNSTGSAGDECIAGC